jgi:hypothetical protein
MSSAIPEYYPVNGKTYSLFGKSDSTSGYYETIKMLADQILDLNPDHRFLIDSIRKFSSKKRILKKIHAIKKKSNLLAEILNLINPHLEKYTLNTEEHLKTLPLSKFLDIRLATTREQYHLYMIEIELTNRLFASEFIMADHKIALLPYCLQDFSVKCKSEKSGFDYQCKHCSVKCFQNNASTILKAHGIEPYIWMEGNMKQMMKYAIKEKRSFGVIGIACIPELTWGMRDCRKNNIPVIGVPLNANRCVRWFGEFFPNSIDLAELDRLLTSDS